MTSYTFGNIEILGNFSFHPRHPSKQSTSYKVQGAIRQQHVITHTREGFTCSTGSLFIRLVRQVKWKVAQEHCTHTIWHPITSVAQHICINSSAESSVRAPIRFHLVMGKELKFPYMRNVLDSDESIRKPKTQLVSTCCD